MSYEYRLEAPEHLTDSQLEAARAWFASVEDAVVHSDDLETWYLFADVPERDRRLARWRRDTSKSDYLTSFIVVRPDGAALSLVEDDADRVAVAFATWWLDTFGGRLLDAGAVISPTALMPPEHGAE
ncbi:MAG: hypothetical protein ACON5B_14320 [Myxococcota bacterium]